MLVSGLRKLRDQYPQAGSIAISGHAHIDLAWLWPIEETRRKAVRTFHTAVDLMERYPDYRFNQSTAQYYAWLEEDDPALLARIKEKVAAGQWEPIGAMWVEPDTNMPTGESFVRQLLYGIRYFDKAFGRDRPHDRELAARLLRLLARLPAASETRRPRQLLHPQDQLVGAQQASVGPLLVGGARWLACADAHFRQSCRRLQRLDRPARGGRDVAQLSGQGEQSREPAALRLGRRRRRTDREHASAHRPACRFSRDAGASLRQRFRLVRRNREARRQRKPAGMGRRDLSRVPSRHTDDAGAGRSTCIAAPSAR